jgi:hypothetical protein
MEESKNGRPMIEESEEANKLKQELSQVDLLDTANVIRMFSRMEALCSEIKGIKMTIMLQLDYIRDQKEYEKSLKT